MDPLQTAFRQALRFALDFHTGQTRAGSSVPYIVHPVAVGETLALHYPDNLDLVVAGVLHDVVEDTDATLDLVERRFGPTVARLVDAVTRPEHLADLPDDPLARWQAKRDAQLVKLRAANDDAHRLKAADTLANLRSIARDLARTATPGHVWRTFHGTEAQTTAFYGAVVALVRERLRDPTDASLVAELQAAADAVGAGGPR